jgi:hypothetical protein
MSHTTIRTWTPEQIELLRNLVRKNVSPFRAPVVLKRTASSVQLKAREIGMAFPWQSSSQTTGPRS